MSLEDFVCSNTAVRTSSPTCSCFCIFNFLFIPVQKLNFRPAHTTYELANVHDKFLLEAHADRTAPHHRSCSHETGLACKTSRLVRPTSSETSVKYYMRLAQCKKHYKLTLLKRRLWSNGHGVSYFQGN